MQLALQRGDTLGQQPFQTELNTLVVSEGRPAIEPWHAQDVAPVDVDSDAGSVVTG